MRRGLVMALRLPQRPSCEDARIADLRTRLAMGDPDLVLLTKEDVGLLAGIDERTVSRRIADGDLLAVKLGHLVRVRVADYRAFLSGSRVPRVRPASAASPPPGPPERSVRDERPLTDLLSEITTEAS